MSRGVGMTVRSLSVLLALTLAAASVASPRQLTLVRSSPEAGAQLERAPERIRLWFSASPELAVSLIRLTGPDGPVELGEIRAADEDSLVVPVVGGLVPGPYRVTWRTSVGGGRPARGTYDFSLLGR